MSLTELIRTLRRKVNCLMGLASDVEQDPVYIEAKRWTESRAAPSKDEGDCALAKDASEYGQKQFDDLVAAYERGDDKASESMRHNAYLIAGVFTFFRSQSEAIPVTVKLSLACWMIAMLFLSVMTRRLWRPAGCELSQMQDFIDTKDPRLHAWLNSCTHLAIVKLRVTLNSEAKIFNISLVFTITGLVLLLVSTFFA